MKMIFKRALALVLVASTLLALALLVSCGGTTGAVEEFLTSDNYTFKAGKLTVMADGSTIYFNNGSVEKYLYFSREERRYFYCEINKDKKVSKEDIDSEEYIVYHGEMVSTVAQTSKILTGFLQASHMVEEVDGTYTVGTYTVKEADGVITCTMDKSKAEISDVGSTKIEIPTKVLEAIAD